MRTTIELKDEHRARLLAIAAGRGEKGFSNLINEAVEMCHELGIAGLPLGAAVSVQRLGA